jgi:spermidine/putrescine transport system ATP-binding protein
MNNNILLELNGIAKSFGETQVLEDISFAVHAGEFVTLLGSSGCGKTTTLRIIAGLEQPDAGRVTLDGVDVTGLPPNRRSVNTVFQEYALFPHMTVEKNIGYSLRLRHVPKEQIQERVKRLLELVSLPGYEKRYPAELSGGQSQRVAIARALAAQPKLLLLDEPLGALDLQLRRKMQGELKQIQQKLGISFVYITHDQEEALSMSDRVAVMHCGRLEQYDTVSGIYHQPKTAYVAQFVGSANIVTGDIIAVEGEMITVARPDGVIRAQSGGRKLKIGEIVSVAVRQEQIDLLSATERDSGLSATVKGKLYAGGQLRITTELADGTQIVAAKLGVDSPLKTGDEVIVTWQGDSGLAVD